VSEDTGESAEHTQRNPLRRTLDLCVFAPVGLAVTVVEDLPDLISKGRRRVELELGNARVVGRFVVNKGQRRVSGTLDDFRRSSAEERAEPTARGTAPGPAVAPVPPPAPAPPDPWWPASGRHGTGGRLRD